MIFLQHELRETLLQILVTSSEFILIGIEKEHPHETCFSLPVGFVMDLSKDEDDADSDINSLLNALEGIEQCFIVGKNEFLSSG